MEGIFTAFNLAIPNINHKLLVFFFLLFKFGQADSLQIISPEFINDSLKTNISPLTITYVDGTDTLDTNINLNSGINKLVLTSSSDDSSKLVIDYRNMLAFTRNFPTHSPYYTNKPDLTLSYSILFLDSVSDPANDIHTFNKVLKEEGENIIHIDETDDYGNQIADTIVAILDSSAAYFTLPHRQVHVPKNSDRINLVISPFECTDSNGIEEIKASISYYLKEKRNIKTMPIQLSQISSEITIDLPAVDSLTLEVRIRDYAQNDTSFRYTYYKDTEGPSIAFNVSSNLHFQDSEVNIQNLVIEDPNLVESASVVFYPGTEASKKLTLVYDPTSKSYGLKTPYQLKGSKADFSFFTRDTLGNEFQSEKKQIYLQSTQFDWRNKVQKKWHIVGFPRAVRTSEWKPHNDEKSTWILENGQFVFKEDLDPVIYPGQGFLWGSYDETITFKDDWWIDAFDSIEVDKGWNILSLGSDKSVKASNYDVDDVYKIEYIENAPSIVRLEPGDTLLPYSGYLYLHRDESVKKINFPISKTSQKKGQSSTNINITIQEKISDRKVYIHSKGNTPFLSIPQGQAEFYIQNSERKWLQVAPNQVSKSILVYESTKNQTAQFDFKMDRAEVAWVIVDLKTGANITNKEVSLRPGQNFFMLKDKKEIKQNRPLMEKLINYKIISGYPAGSSQLIVQLSEDAPTGFPIQLYIYNSKGIELKRQEFFLQKLSESFLFETSDLTPGLHYFTLKSYVLPSQPFQKILVRK